MRKTKSFIKKRKEPKTFRGKMRRTLTGDGRKTFKKR